MEINRNTLSNMKAWLDERFPRRRGAVGPVERIEHMPHPTEYQSSGREHAEQRQREGSHAAVPAQPVTTDSEQTDDGGVIYDRKGAVHPIIQPGTLDVTG